MDLKHCQHQCVLLTDQHPHAMHGECAHAGTLLLQVSGSPPPCFPEHIAASVLEPHYSQLMLVVTWHNHSRISSVLHVEAGVSIWFCDLIESPQFPPSLLTLFLEA